MYKYLIIMLLCLTLDLQAYQAYEADNPEKRVEIQMELTPNQYIIKLIEDGYCETFGQAAIMTNKSLTGIGIYVEKEGEWFFEIIVGVYPAVVVTTNEKTTKLFAYIIPEDMGDSL